MKISDLTERQIQLMIGRKKRIDSTMDLKTLHHAGLVGWNNGKWHFTPQGMEACALVLERDELIYDLYHDTYDGLSADVRLAAHDRIEEIEEIFENLTNK